jgi:hypothetical protein
MVLVELERRRVTKPEGEQIGYTWKSILELDHYKGEEAE